MKDTYYELLNYGKQRSVMNTHSHHGKDEKFEEFGLEDLLQNSYVGWLGVPFGKDAVSRRTYLEKVRYNSYFKWLERSLQELYDLQEPLSEANWEGLSYRIRAAHQARGRHIELLREQCGYEKIILDAYWNPGDDNGYSQLFTPTFRINMFLFGYSKDAQDHNGNNPQRIYGVDIQDIDEYIAFMRKIIAAKKKQGCVALKSALAYDRGLNFQEMTRDKAQRAFLGDGQGRSQEDIKAFQDYVFFQICKIAAEFNMPLQNHTGLGLLKNSNAMQMQEVIEKNPDTRFVLFHGGYPWMDDVLGLVHVYPNVYPDLCWLPLISTSAAERMLEELLDVTTSEKITWGCDTWTSEESYGALLAVRHVLAAVLSRRIDRGYDTLEEGRILMDRILYHNAKDLYGL